MMKEVLLAIDGGASRTRCLAIERTGLTIGDAESGPSNHLLIAEETVRRSLDAATAATLAQCGLRAADVACVSAGFAGVDYDGTGAAAMEAMLGELGFARTVVNGDMVIAHAGALSNRPGVLALAGTGSSILGVGPGGERVKVGGWGPIYGNEGSAYRIGEGALIAAARAYDGRGRQTALLAAMVRALGLRDFRESIARIYAGRMESQEIAALSRIADEVARHGDEVARALFLEAGDELAEAVHAAARRLDMDHAPVVVCYQGSLIEQCPLVLGRFRESVHMRLPHACVIAPRWKPIFGAYLLGCQAVGWEANLP